MVDCFAKVTREEGLMRFYRGYVYCLLSFLEPKAGKVLSFCGKVANSDDRFGTYYVRIAPHAMVTLIVADWLGFITK